MIEYANDMVSGKVKVNRARVLMAKRFLSDLENPQYEINETDVSFVVLLIENTFKHIKGPARGKLFKLEKWQKFIIYNLVGFVDRETGLRRFQEAFIFLPRKNSKTFFASALSWALSMLYRNKFSVLYIIATKLDRALEAFNNILENLYLMGEADNFKILDSHTEHSIHRRFYENGEPTGELKIQALPADAKRADGLNANIIILDEIHGYKNANEYYVYKQAMKAYDEKLLIGITTAGQNMNSFCYERLNYCRKILDGTAKDESYFVFIAEADDPVDYLNPYQHEIANPNYGVTINPKEIANEAYQAQNDPTGRTEFLNKSLNIYVNTMDAYFSVDEFRESDSKYDWSLEELAKLPIKWYGGADLSKMHDLTAACLYGEYKGVDIAITHAFFPITEAHRKAEEDNIPIFGWMDDGLLTMSNTATVHYDDVVDWFKGMRDKGFKIRRVGFDQRFGREFFMAMKKAGFKMVYSKQYYDVKSQGFRRIERKVKDREFYYLHSEAYEYCVSNVKAIEDTDDMIKFSKVMPKQRIDIFDASVFACYEMLKDMKNNEILEKFLDV